MSAPGIRKHLRWKGVGWLVCGLGILLIGVMPLALFALPVLLYGLDPLTAIRREWRLLPLCGVLIAVSLFGLYWGVCCLWGWRRHPAVLALARYGPPEEVVAAIDRELARSEPVVRFGGAVLTPGRLYLTASWLVYLPRDGDWFNCLRLSSIVRAFSAPSALRTPLVRGQSPAQAVFEDCNGNGFAVPETEAGVARLLAEVIARVPWALSHFDEDAGASTSQAHEEIVAADPRGEQIRRGVGS